MKTPSRIEMWSDHWSTNEPTLTKALMVFGEAFTDPCTSRNSHSTLSSRSLRAAIRPIFDNDFLLDDYTGGKYAFMNPPYSKAVGGAGAFTDRMISLVNDDECPLEAAIILVNASTDTAWWQRLAEASRYVCLAKGRQKYDRVLDSRVLLLSKEDRADWEKKMTRLGDLFTQKYSLNLQYGFGFQDNIEYVREAGNQPRYANCFHLVTNANAKGSVVERFAEVFGRLGYIAERGL